MAVIEIHNIRDNLRQVIDYGQNGEKTQQGLFVSTVNCAVSTAYDEMELTKKFYQKEDGILGYHIIQSFKGKEVSPAKANKIGNKLAEEMWGDRFQVIVCTHTNTENIHNHIIVNSVSCVDGLKYHNSKTNIDILKEVSDRLCFDNGLSVVNTSKANKIKEDRQKRIDDFSRTDEKMQKVINDIDEAIKSAKKYSDFKLFLEAKGYSKIDGTGKYFSMKTPYYSRNIRIDKTFGDDYSFEGIKERIYGYREDKPIPFANYKVKYYKKVFKGPKIDWKLYKNNCFYAWYVAALYILKILPAKATIQEVSAKDYKVDKKVKIKFEELNYINRSHSKSIEDIKTHKKEIEDKLPVLKGERENLWVKYKKTINIEEKEKIKNKIDFFSDEIYTMYGQRNACKGIIETYNKVYEEIEKEKGEKEKLKELTEKSKKEKSKNRY